MAQPLHRSALSAQSAPFQLQLQAGQPQAQLQHQQQQQQIKADFQTSSVELQQEYKRSLEQKREQEELQKKIVSKRKLADLVQEIDPKQDIDATVEEVLTELTADFVDKVVAFSCQLAKHRGSDTLELKDVQLHLDRTWGIRLPGFGLDEVKVIQPPKQAQNVKAVSTTKRKKVD